MKISKYEFGGPNIQGWLLIAFILYMTVTDSIKWLIGFLLFFIVLVPVCYKLNEWNKKGDDAKVV